MALTKALMKVSTQEQAAAWISEYSQWEATWEVFLKHRTEARTGAERPSAVLASRLWWYTHQRLRRARGFYRSLIKHQNLFFWLETDLQPANGSKIHRTTSPLEGGPNKAIKELLRAHRGMPDAHARTAVNWLLDSLTEYPRQPWTLAREEHWDPPRKQRKIKEEPAGPALYDREFSWEDGNGVQHGWGGRSRP